MHSSKENSQVALQSKDLELLTELEKQLDKLRMEREANNIFATNTQNNMFENIIENKHSELHEENKNVPVKNDEKANILNNDKVNDQEIENKTIKNKVDMLFSAKNSEVLSEHQLGILDKIKDLDLREKIGIL